MDGRGVIIEAGVPVSALTGVDDNLDGLLQPDEISSHVLEILAQLDSLIQVDLGATNGVVTQNDLTTSVYVDDLQSAAQLEWIRTTTYPDDLPADWPITVTLDRAYLDLAYSIKVERNGDADAAVIEPGQSAHVFFGSVWDAFTSYISFGFEHILGGPDHIVFLVVLLLDKVSWRRWSLLLATFTLAHGITYALATLRFVDPPVDIVEQLIAVSIVVMALKRFFGVQTTFPWDVALVFAFGLVHGLGFASAMVGEMSAYDFPVVTIAGFNIGIELGQLAIAATLLLILKAAKRIVPFPKNPENFRWLALIPAAIGMYWLLQRL